MHVCVLHCHWNAIATQLGQVPCLPRGILSRPEKQSRTRGGQSGGVADQSQYRRLWYRRTPSARSFSRSPSAPPFTQYPFPPRSLVRDGQTSRHKPRLVVSHSTCPPPPHANSFVIGPAVINNNNVTRFCTSFAPRAATVVRLVYTSLVSSHPTGHVLTLYLAPPTRKVVQ
jgi:hypothetical protein